MRRLVGAGGYTAVEMIVVMLILGTVLGSLTAVFVQSTNAELDLNNRFQAQLQARLALDKLRREVHCASAITPAGAAASITLTLPTQCPTGSGSVSWCTVSLGTSRYGLFRKAGATCDSGGTKYADYLTAASVFTYTGQSTSSLAKLRVDFPVNVNPSKAFQSYELVDDIVLRNSTRA